MSTLMYSNNMQTNVSFETILQRPSLKLDDVTRRLIGLRLHRLLMTHFGEDKMVIAYWAGIAGKQYLAKWFNGEILPRAEALVRMADHGFNVQWILTGKGYPYDVSTEKGRALADTGYVITAPTVADLDGFTSDASEQEVHA